ncbi:MAG: GNAT family N-acetyltransferase [Chloroflexi bacterium]|nr:GNAT family N-acetyltransferase [Chloroflexota bacterium]
MITSRNLHLIPCAMAHYEAILRNKKELETMLEVSVPDRWPIFPEVYPYAYHVLRADPSIADWWTYLFVHAGDRVLVGSGGFKGKPDDSGSVEIGYEVVPEYRNRGLATEAAQAMMDYAFSHAEVKLVQAHTLPEENASTTVLRKVGMHFAAAVQNPDDGEVWRWVIMRDEYQVG